MIGGVGSDRPYNLTISVNISNVLNNVNAAAPIGNLSSPLFGQSVSLASGGISFGGGGFGGGFRREIDEETLQQIADLTGGEYYPATSAAELQEVFQNLPTYVIATRETTEISVFFTAFAVLAAIIAIILAFRWHPLP